MVKFRHGETNFKSGQMRSNIIDAGQIFRAPGARTARNTRLLFCIVHSVLDRFCDDQRPEPQLQCRHGGATTGRGELTTLDCWRDVETLCPLLSQLHMQSTLHTPVSL